jgi:hypothetical protein
MQLTSEATRNRPLSSRHRQQQRHQVLLGLVHCLRLDLLLHAAVGAARLASRDCLFRPHFLHPHCQYLLLVLTQTLLPLLNQILLLLLLLQALLLGLLAWGP